MANQGRTKRMQATARRLSVVTATSRARRRLIRDVRPLPRAMKKFVARFYLVSVLAVVLVTELAWALLLSFGNNNEGSSLVTRLLFPVLFLVGTLHHFRSR
jgi:hypothetical protein